VYQLGNKLLDRLYRLVILRLAGGSIMRRSAFVGMTAIMIASFTDLVSARSWVSQTLAAKVREAAVCRASPPSPD